MIKALEQAIADLSRLPETDQKQIGRKLLSHVEKIRAFRADLDSGLRSLEDGKGRTLDIEDMIRRKNAEYRGA